MGNEEVFSFFFFFPLALRNMVEQNFKLANIRNIAGLISFPEGDFSSTKVVSGNDTCYIPCKFSLKSEF